MLGFARNIVPHFFVWGSNFLFDIRRPPPAESHRPAILPVSLCLYQLVSINLSVATCL